MRARVGFVSGSVVRSLRAALDAEDIVVTGKYGALEPWWNTYTDADRAKARELMAFTGVDALASRPFGVISEGERQQVLLARLLMESRGSCCSTSRSQAWTSARVNACSAGSARWPATRRPRRSCSSPITSRRSRPGSRTR